jgi:hypothetical protein
MHIAIMFLFTPMHRWIGRSSALRLYQLCMMMWPLVTLFYPLMNFLAKREGASGSLFNGVMFAFFVVWRYVQLQNTCNALLILSYHSVSLHSAGREQRKIFLIRSQ